MLAASRDALKGDVVKVEIRDIDARFSPDTNLTVSIGEVTGNDTTDDLKTRMESAEVTESSPVAIPEIFVGRDECLIQAITHIQSTPAAKTAIVGPDGVGKTSLARAIIRDSRVQTHFQNACRFVSCEPLKSGHDLLLAILNALDISVHPKEQDIFTFLYQQLLKAGRLLLVLDNLDTLWADGLNASSVVDDVERVIELLGSLYSTTFLITMKGAEPPSSVSWTLVLQEGGLPSLKPEDALLLFDSNCQDLVHAKGQPQEDVSELLQSINYLPLAVVLISRLQKSLSPAEILPLILKSNEEEVEPLHAVLSVVLSSPPMITHPEASSLLAVLSFLPDGVPHYIDLLPKFAPDLGDTATVLLQASLARVTSDEVLTILPPIRTYITNNPLFHETGADVFWNIYTFIHRSALVNGDDDSVLLLGPRNVSRVLEYFLDNHPSIEVASKALRVSVWLAKRKGEANNSMLGKIQQVYQSLEDPSLLADYYRLSSQLFYDLSDFAEARDLARRSYDLYKSAGDSVGMGGALIDMGLAWQKAGDNVEAFSVHQRAYSIFEELGDKDKMARCLYGMASCTRVGGKYTESKEYCIKAYDMLKGREDIDVFCFADVVYSWGLTLKMEGEYDNALEKYQEAQDIFAKIPVPGGVAFTSNSMGAILTMKGQPEEALKKHQEAGKILRELQNQVETAKTLDYIGEALYALGRYEEAVAKHKESYGILRSFNDHLGMGNSLTNWGCALLAMQLYEAAAEKQRRAAEIFRAVQMPRGVANALIELGKSLYGMGEDGEAVPACRQAYEIFEQVGIASMMAACLYWEGAALQSMDNDVEAKVRWRKAYGLYRKSQYDVGMQLCLQKLKVDSIEEAGGAIEE